MAIGKAIHLRIPGQAKAVIYLKKFSKTKCLFWISKVSVLDFEVYNRDIIY